MRTIIIGDVHGAFFELMALLKELRIKKTDRLYFLGDLIDKGEYGPEVLKQIRTNGWTSVLGNHEERWLRWYNHELKYQLTGQKNPMASRDEDHVLLKALDSKDIEWMKQLPLALCIPGYDISITHGGISPNLQRLPVPKVFENLSGKKKKYAKTCLRLRYIDSRGHMVSLGKETDRDVFWATKYDGRFGHVIFGHQPWMQARPPKWKFATGMDLGVAHGGRLCALLIQPDFDPEYVSVPALKTYSPPLEQQLKETTTT